MLEMSALEVDFSRSRKLKFDGVTVLDSYLTVIVNHQPVLISGIQGFDVLVTLNLTFKVTKCQM